MKKPSNKVTSLFEPKILLPAIMDSFKKLDPRHQIKNPVMFVVLVGSVLTTGLIMDTSLGEVMVRAGAGFILAISFMVMVYHCFREFCGGHG